MRTRVPAVSPLLLSLVLLVAARDVDTKKAPADLTASDINTCVQQNFPDDSMIQTVKMLMKDRMGVERLLEAVPPPKSALAGWFARARSMSSSVAARTSANSGSASIRPCPGRGAARAAASGAPLIRDRHGL